MVQQRSQYVIVAVMVTLFHCCQSFDLTIMHTNDVHARFEQFKEDGSSCSLEDAGIGLCFGGVSRRVTKIDEIRNIHQNTLLIDGGNQFQGTKWFQHYQGRATSYFMNLLGYQAMALGNHEFTNGVEGLIDFLKQSSFPVLSCNIDASAEPEFESLIKKSVMLEIGGEIIGVIGYSSYKTREISKSGRNLVFLDEAASIQAEIDDLSAAGVNKIIALGHSGYARDIEIAKNTVGLDVLVGGQHNDTFLYSGTPPTDDIIEGSYPTVVHPDGAPNDDVLIVQASTFAKYLGSLQVTFDEAGKVIHHSGNPIVLDAGVLEDDATLDEIENWALSIEDFKHTVVGETFVLLEGDEFTCRSEECTMGDVITDAMLENLVKFQSEESWSDVAVSILDSDAIQAPINQGLIAVSDVPTVLPFEETFDIFDLKGSYLLKALENSVEHYGKPSLSGRFLQMSGIKVTYDLKMPPSARVVSVAIKCTVCAVPRYEPLDVERKYRIVANSYLVSGGGGYTMISENLENLITGEFDAGVLTDYIAKNSPIIQGRERRIIFAEDEASSAKRKE